MTKLASLWVGSKLGAIEQASAKSFIANGNELIIYAYAPLEGVPNGVQVLDANEILPAEEIIRHRKTGSPALHSDLFRYALIDKTSAIWVDLDVIALRPLNFANEWVFGYESDKLVNGAILRFPADSRTFEALRAFNKDTKGIPPHIQGLRRWKYALRSWLVGGLPIDRWPWGGIGPAAITHFLKETGEIEHALPRSAFYAIGVSEVEKFLAPASEVMAQIPDDAWAVHLWGKELRAVLQSKHGGKVPPGSFLAQWL